MKKNIDTLLFLAFLSGMAGGTAGAAEKFAGDFLSLGSGAKALGMGEALVAVVDDATSSYYNPAGLARLEVRDLNLMHSEQFGGLENYNTISFGSPLSGSLYGGVCLIHLGVGDIKYTRLWDPSKTLSDSNRVEIKSREDAVDYALYLSGAKRINGKLDVGVAVKLIRRAVGDDTAYGYGLDVGLRFKLPAGWDFGVTARDVTGTTIAWDGRSNDRIAPTMDVGLAYRGDVPWVGGDYIIAASMLYFGDSPKVKGIGTMNLGMEYHLNEILAFRAGSSSGDGTFGLGIKRLPLISSSSLDYAFLSHHALDSTHRVSLSIRF